MGVSRGNPSLSSGRAVAARQGVVLEQFAEGKSDVGAQSDCHPAGLLRQRVPNPTVVGLSGGTQRVGVLFRLQHMESMLKYVEIP